VVIVDCLSGVVEFSLELLQILAREDQQEFAIEELNVPKNPPGCTQATGKGRFLIAIDILQQHVAAQLTNLKGMLVPIHCLPRLH
jgi:hypothetical protein